MREPIHNIVIRGHPVPEEVLQNIWEDIKGDLAIDFPLVKAITMPPVQAWIVPSKIYLKLKKQMLGSSNVHDTSKGEWGTKVRSAESSAALFFSDVLEVWVIIKRKGFGYPVEVDLKHELTHVYEAIMLLPWGTLTRKLP